MLERSELGDRTIATCLHDRYGLDGVEIKFLRICSGLWRQEELARLEERIKVLCSPGAE